MTLEDFTAQVIAKLEQGEDALLPGLGTLKVSLRPAREGRYLRSGMKIKIPARRSVRFVPSKALRAALNK